MKTGRDKLASRMTIRIHRALLGIFAAAGISLLTAAPARAAFLVEDKVEATGVYTQTGLDAFSAVAGGVAGGGSSHLRGSKSAGEIRSGGVRLTAGFGSIYPIQAGTYTLTMYANGSTGPPGRERWSALEPFLKTTSSLTALPDKTVTKAYVQDATVWPDVVVQYVVPPGHALIGLEFTWGFDFSIDSTSGYICDFDWASVDFDVYVPAGTVLIIR